MGPRVNEAPIYEHMKSGGLHRSIPVEHAVRIVWPPFGHLRVSM